MFVGVDWAEGGFRAVGAFAATQWAAVICPGIAGGAVAFFLWAFALARTSPTRVAVAVTANPIAAAAVGALLLSESIPVSLMIGLAVVASGICVAASGPASDLARDDPGLRR